MRLSADPSGGLKGLMQLDMKGMYTAVHVAKSLGQLDTFRCGHGTACWFLLALRRTVEGSPQTQLNLGAPARAGPGAQCPALDQGSGCCAAESMVQNAEMPETACFCVGDMLTNVFCCRLRVRIGC
jgi:hypothetical protein